MSLLASLLGLSLAFGPTAPQAVSPSPQVEQPTVIPDVEVEGRRQSAYEAARSFVGEVTRTTRNRGVGRWDGRVCVGIANMQVSTAQPLIDRMSARILDLGLDIGEPGCRPNVLVVATEDGAGMARGLVRARYHTFQPGVSGTRLSLPALRAFQNTEAPVRWWRLTLPVDEMTGDITVRIPNWPPSRRDIRYPSRLRTQDRIVFNRVFIIVDLAKLQNVDVGALGDYLAMVSLAQIDADAQVSGYGSILNLFTDPSGPREMTAWDQTYLRALYAAELNERIVSHQMGRMARLMARDPGAVDPEAPPGD